MAVALLAGTYKLNLMLAVFYLCGTEIRIYRQVCSTAEPLAEGACHFNALAHDNDVNVCRWTLQENVADVSANNVTLHLQAVGRLAYLAENGGVKQLA